MKIGVFGGTFDPPHYGHLRLATAAQRRLGLNKVLWVLTADPPHKQDCAVSPVEDRLALVRAAIAHKPRFEISRVDIDRPGPHWAADTVALLGRQHPGDELIYLMGGDSLHDLPDWGRPLEFLAGCTLGVLRRPGDHVDLERLERQLPGVTARVHLIDVAPIDISAQDVRERVRLGQSIRGLVPPRVAALIERRGLYVGRGPGAAALRPAARRGP